MASGLSPKKQIASVLFPRYSRFIDKLNWNARWLSTIKQAGNVPRFPKRDDLHEFVSRTFGNRPIDYLEFGVFQGESLRMWVAMNTHPDSRFFGFDSFRGLPEDWNEYPKGTCDLAGKTPDISDSRVTFVVGWFQQTLPGFLAEFQPEDRQLVIHIDADLYSSTLFALTSLNGVIRPGTVIIFDEFGDVLDEYRALVDYTSAYGRSYRITGGTDGFARAAVEIT